MRLQELETQFAYNEWANGLLLAAGGSLHQGDQNKNLGASHRSVLGTLFHLVYSEWDWLHFWRGKPWEEIVKEEPPESNFPNIALLQPQWVVIVSEQKTFLASLSDEALNQQISYKNFAGDSCEFSLGETVQHLLNHSGYHRGQVVTLLRQLGKAPPATDYLVFLRERRSSNPWVP